MSWKDNFDYTILLRGFNISEEQDIFPIKNDNFIIAKVNGSRQYSVSIDSIDIEDDSKYSCDCPYALGGNNCKHMAALLYTYEAMGKNNEIIIKEDIKAPSEILEENKEKILKEYLQQCDSLELNDFFDYLIDKNIIDHKTLEDYNIYKNTNPFNELENFVNGNGEFIMVPIDKVNTFFINSKKTDDLSPLNNLVNDFKSIIQYHSRNGYINYYEGYDFTYDVGIFLEKTFKNIVRMKNVKLGEKFFYSILNIIDNIDMDESSGEYDVILCYLKDGLIRILNISNLEEREVILNNLINYYENSLEYETPFFVKEFIFSSFRELNLKEKHLNFISNEISNEDSTNNFHYSVSLVLESLKLKEYYGENIEIDLLDRIYSIYFLNYFIQYKIKNDEKESLLKELKKIEKDVLSFKKLYSSDKNMKDLNEHDFIKYNRNLYYYSTYLKTVKVSIKDLSLDLGNFDIYKKVLLELIIENKYFNLEEILDLKNKISKKKWDEVKKSLETIVYQKGLLEFYYFENMIENILRFSTSDLKNEPEIFQKLKDNYPNEIIKLYTDEIKEDCVNTSNRTTYKLIALKIKDLSTLSLEVNGKDLGFSLKEELIRAYSKRSAMKEEFNSIFWNK